MRYIKSALFIFLCFLLVGCKAESTFNPYKHMSRILTITRQEQYDVDKDYILQHTDSSLCEKIDDALTGTVGDSSYTICERNVFVEQKDEHVKLIAEYDCTSLQGNYLLVAFFEYENDMLILYDTHKIFKAEGF